MRKYGRTFFYTQKKVILIIHGALVIIHGALVINKIKIKIKIAVNYKMAIGEMIINHSNQIIVCREQKGWFQGEPYDLYIGHSSNPSSTLPDTG